MRSFQQVVVLLFALFVFALAQDAAPYDATVYITSTVFRVNTVTMSGTPTASVANQTSTISAAAATLVPYPSGNGTIPSAVIPSAVIPSGSGTVTVPSESAPAFTGAASHLNVNALVAALAAGVGYMAL